MGSGQAQTGRLASILALRTNQLASNTTAQVDTISLTISDRISSMSAVGFAAAALLMVLAAGYALQRRF